MLFFFLSLSSSFFLSFLYHSTSFFEKYALILPCVLRAAQRVGFTVCSIYKLLLRYYSNCSIIIMCEKKNRRSSWFLRGDLGWERIVVSIMTGNRCVLCASTRATDSGASLHRFPADKTARARWIANLQLGRLHSREYGFTALAPSCRFAIHLALAVLSAGKR